MRVVLDQNIKEYEVKYKCHGNIVQNKNENQMMLIIWNLCRNDLFSIGIYRFIETKMYLTVMSVCMFMYMRNQHTRMHAIDSTATPITAARWL